MYYMGVLESNLIFNCQRESLITQFYQVLHCVLIQTIIRYVCQWFAMPSMYCYRRVCHTVDDDAG